MQRERPALRELLALGLALGAGAGAVEVALLAEPRLGMDAGQVAAWLALSVALSCAWMGAAALVAWSVGRRAHGLVLAALVAVHAGIGYRFRFAVNAFLRDPAVWGALLGIAAAALALGVALDGPLRRARRRVVALALGAAVLAAPAALLRAGGGGHGEPAAADGPPRVLLVTLDTTRADRIGAYGGRAGTPNVDRVAREGVRFAEVVATAPLTEPSHLAVLSGEPPHRSGLVTNGTAIGERPGLISRALGERGYATAAFVSGFPLHGRFGWGRGFDVYDDDFGTIAGLHRLAVVRLWDQLTLPGHVLRERRGDRAVDRALRWLDRHADERFFLWVHLFDPHAPYEAPGHPFDPPTDGEALPLPAWWPPRHRAITSEEWLVRAYEAEIRFADAQLGRLLAALERRGVLDDTLVVVTADHGESLTEHGYLFDHGDHLYDASLLVPWVMRLPGRLPAGAVLDCQVSNLDVAPTILGLLGVDDGIARTGRDRSAEIAAGRCADEPVVSTTVAGRFVERPPVDHSLRADGWKVVIHAATEERPERVECFDHAADPAEDRPLADCPPDLVRRLRAEITAGSGPVAPELDGEVRGALEALGYIDGGGD